MKKLNIYKIFIPKYNICTRKSSKEEKIQFLQDKCGNLMNEVSASIINNFGDFVIKSKNINDVAYSSALNFFYALLENRRSIKLKAFQNYFLKLF